MDNELRFSEADIATMTQRLRSRVRILHHQVEADLAGEEFEQFERTPHLAFLMSALNSPALRERAQASLTRVLRGLDNEDLKSLGAGECAQLKRSLSLMKPQLHADFLLSAIRVLLQLGDTSAIASLEQLKSRSTITQYVVRRTGALGQTYREIVRSFKGSRAEENNMRRVRSAAHVACERLKRLDEDVPTLLRPAPRGAASELLLPASTSSVNQDRLLHPDSEIEPT